MNPAYSVILFTTASGAGYGLLALLGLVAVMHGPASSFAFAITTLAIALILVTVGLLSSTLHLGRPERFWRAFSQWRSSWLSREGIAAMVTYAVALAFGLVWSGMTAAPASLPALGVLVLVMCAVTVFCTGKIYSTLKTIRAWHHPLTVPVYLAFATATGSGLLMALASAFGRYQTAQAVIFHLAIIAVAILKVSYWRSVDGAKRTHTMAAATGLASKQGETVRQWELPHTNVNFIQKEMGYAVARRHVAKLRMLVLVGFLLAMLFSLAALYVNPLISWLAAASVLLAAWVERWLFFAEAEHVVGLYYGAEAA